MVRYDGVGLGVALALAALMLKFCWFIHFGVPPVIVRGSVMKSADLSAGGGRESRWGLVLSVGVLGCWGGKSGGFRTTADKWENDSRTTINFQTRQREVGKLSLPRFSSEVELLSQ